MTLCEGEEDVREEDHGATKCISPETLTPY